MKKLLRDGLVYKCLEGLDVDLACGVRSGGCQACGGRLHRSDYRRKPRGGPPEVLAGWDKRASFCCERAGCRQRHTPPSVRFMGRKVYIGVVVVLVSALMNGANARRLGSLRDALGIDGRTLARWRQWWLEHFVQTPFWKAHRGRFMPGLAEGALPSCLVVVFKATGREGLLRLMRFLCPLTTVSSQEAGVM